MATKEPEFQPYSHPAAGWGAARNVGKFLLRERQLFGGSRAVLTMNHDRSGFDCPGCAWPDDPNGLKLDVCENGIKHVSWEMTGKRVGPEFFAAHTVTELDTWSNFELEDQGRLTEPMRYDAATDRYLPVSWQEAFELIGSSLRGLESPNQASYYTSGRLSNEATFLYQLMARELGTNNLPDCSNMCHEASGRALRASIGTGKGTVDLHDWEQADALFILGVNAASNAPRMLTALADAHERGAQIVHINPLVEVGATKTIIPHDFVKMAMNHTTETSTMNVQPRIGGDMALLRGIAKAVFERAETDPTALDTAFLDEFASGVAEYREIVAGTEWAQIEELSAVSRAQIEAMATIYLESEKAIFSWCLGITQHEHGVDTIREIANVLLLRGNVGRAGAGPSPVRGHSNVQGNRTCGIDHHPTDAWLDRLAAATGIEPPRAPGLDTVKTIEAMASGQVKVFIGMGGNFVLAAPDTEYTTAALRNTELTVQVSTKLNRSHLVHGRDALILPCLGRTERDERRGGEQSVSVEDAMSMVHLSRGKKKPASPYLLSEPAIIAAMARAALPGSQTPWEAYADDYDAIRDVMAVALEGFENFNSRVREPLGFRIEQGARERVFLTGSGRAEFSLAPLPSNQNAHGTLSLATVRSHDQWNTTIYSDDDRYRGVKNLRTLVFMNEADMAERNLELFDDVDIVSTAKDGSTRSVTRYKAIPYDIPRGCAAGYMPELNVLCAIGDFSTQSDQPIMKNVKVTIEASAPTNGIG